VREGDAFFNFYNHDFVRVAAAVPAVRAADPQYNAARTTELLEEAARQKAILAVFPELGLAGYSCEDLFHQRPLLDACRAALESVRAASKRFPTVTVVGVPLAIDHRLYNCAVVLHRGNILGVIPKTYLPNYREFYETRQFTGGDVAQRESIDLGDQREVPFGSRLLFRADQQPLFTFHVEICEDVWVPIPPSSHAALAGATVLLNLSASNVTIAKAEYRHLLVASQSSRCLAAYVYTAAGPGESTTDLAWDGHAIVYENGALLAESRRFEATPQLVCAEIDLERLSQERMRQNSFGDSMGRARSELARFRSIRFSLELPREDRLLPARSWERFPYVPADPSKRDQRCAEVYQIQVQGLAKRLESSGIERVAIGVSGGLDSTHALLVCAQAMDRLGLPRRNILAYTMPGFATSERTLEQARALMQAVGCDAHEIDIRASCLQMLADIGHPYAGGERVYDVTFENVQAGERTSHLFRLANLHGAMVVGTSDLSELALGFCTYGVGDHMSHYAVSASVPKTLIRHVIRWVSDTQRFGQDTSQILDCILSTRISPELVPGDAMGEQPEQGSEAMIGPYELQDFHLYYTVRFGYAAPKVAFLAWCAWHDRALGAWPDTPVELRHEYGIGEIKRHLAVFLRRFFGQSQFKRSCIPNAPKVGSGGSLSPRGDWRAPSDGEDTAWMAELDGIPDDE